ncbi:MAG TPA: protein kinase [Pirellulales bacterium]|jgi:serine/threonine protein kinase|nr:protein kinase [Pirellulales bacterium]
MSRDQPSDPTRKPAAKVLDGQFDPAEASSQVPGAPSNVASTISSMAGGMPGSDDPMSTTFEAVAAAYEDDPFAFEVDDAFGNALLTMHRTARLEDRYEVQDRLGAGGMGEVWRAVDRRLRRPVAIKRMNAELADNHKATARFLREARAVAALNHFHIVQVFDFGCDRNGYFIVMEYVEGENLAALVRRTGPLPAAQAIQIALQVCQALAAAHARGVVHRDVKPGNVLWTTDGVPKLSDFGLARLEQMGSDDTQSGMIVGTLDYMAPEQRRDPRMADARSDLWSLAATLYQLLTGSPPRVIRPDDVAEPLQGLLWKALSEAPSERYATAEEFAEALRAVQAEFQRPAAPPVPTDATGRCPKCRSANDASRKFCQRCGESLREPCPRCQQPIVVGAAFCGECGANVDTVVRELRATFEREKLQIEALLGDYRHAEAIAKLESVASGNAPRVGAYATWAACTLDAVREDYQRLREQRSQLFEAAKQRSADHDYQAALRLLEQIPEKFRDEPARALHAHTEQLGRRLRTLAKEIRQAQQDMHLAGLAAKVEQFLDLKPDHAQAKELLARLYARQCAEVRRFEGGYAASTTCLAVFRDGRHLLVGCADGTLRLADLETGRQVQRFTGHEGEVRSVAVSPDEQLILSAGHDGTLRFWDVAQGRELRRCTEHKSSVACAVFSGDGRFALSGGSDRTLGIWDVAAGRQLRRCAGHEAPIVCMAAIHGVARVLSGDAGGMLLLWDVQTGRQIKAIQAHQSPVLAVANSPDGQFAISASGWDAKVAEEYLRLWRIRTGEPIVAFLGAPPVRTVAMTHDGRYVLSGGRDGSLRIWNLTGRELHRYAGHAGEVLGSVIAADCRIAVSVGTDRTIRVWQLPQ